MGGHILINKLFNGPPNNSGDPTDHINKVRDDNRSINLRWASWALQASNRNKPLHIKGKSVYQMDKSGNIIKKWDKIINAADYYKIGHQNITKVCKGERNTCEGFAWKYADEVDIDEEEIWKVVPYESTPNLYASSKGRVKFNDKILTGHVLNGYMCIKIKYIITGYVSAVRINRLVAAAFYGINALFVNHKDGNKLNNCPENLEYTTDSENSQHAVDMGLKVNRTRKVNQLDLNGNYIKTFDSIKEAGEECDTYPSSISNVCAGRRKEVAGFTWEYTDFADENI